jgi:hypothetical protein
VATAHIKPDATAAMASARRVVRVLGKKRMGKNEKDLRIF